MGSYAPSIQRIGIIGAGPTGVAFAKFLLAEKVFDKVDIWEQRDRVGGVWNLSVPERSQRIPLPQTNPRYGQQSARRSAHDALPQEDSLEFESPLYDYLETNIPKPLMAFADKPFAVEDPLFPPHGLVLKYLEEYAADVRHLIRFRHQVERLDREQDVWRMEVRDLKSEQTEVHEYDAIVTANGHYTVPSVPHIQGLEQWSKAYPGAVIHSKAYRRPEDYTGRKVLVIGNSASGLDIAYQVAQEASKPVVLSARSATLFWSGPLPDWRRDIDEVVEFLAPSAYSRAVRCRSGHIEEDIDTVIFCTGYFYSFPFLADFQPPIVTDGLRTRGIYRDLFHIEHPTLVFLVINLKVIPFPLAENQAAVVARVWSGRLDLPKDDMRRWETETIQSNGDGKNFHLKKFPGDCAQVNFLYDWARSATSSASLENDGQGKLGGRWSKELVWLRSKFPEIKGAYTARGNAREEVKSVEELGFDFAKWEESATKEDEEMFMKALC